MSASAGSSAAKVSVLGDSGAAEEVDPVDGAADVEDVEEDVDVDGVMAAGVMMVAGMGGARTVGAGGRVGAAMKVMY